MFANLFDDRGPQEVEIPADGISLDLLRAVYPKQSIASDD
jgi:hypothetical protein